MLAANENYVNNNESGVSKRIIQIAGQDVEVVYRAIEPEKYPSRNNRYRSNNKFDRKLPSSVKNSKQLDNSRSTRDQNVSEKTMTNSQRFIEVNDQNKVQPKTELGNKVETSSTSKSINGRQQTSNSYNNNNVAVISTNEVDSGDRGMPTEPHHQPSQQRQPSSNSKQASTSTSTMKPQYKSNLVKPRIQLNNRFLQLNSIDVNNDDYELGGEPSSKPSKHKPRKHKKSDTSDHHHLLDTGVDIGDDQRKTTPTVHVPKQPSIESMASNKETKSTVADVIIVDECDIDKRSKTNETTITTTTMKYADTAKMNAPLSNGDNNCRANQNISATNIIANGDLLRERKAKKEKERNRYDKMKQQSTADVDKGKGGVGGGGVNKPKSTQTTTTTTTGTTVIGNNGGERNKNVLNDYYYLGKWKQLTNLFQKVLLIILLTFSLVFITIKLVLHFFCPCRSNFNFDLPLPNFITKQ